MALFWMVATVVILASFLLMIIWKLFKAMARSDGNSSPVENQQTQAEIAAKAAIVANDELGMIHQCYKINEFGTIQGLKDPEW
jgi:hypothetical protein